MTGHGPERPVPPILVVRLRSRLPDGTVVDESRRVCHLVPVPDSAAVPEVLCAYCGLEIEPGTAELLDSMSGMPCERCLAHSPSHTVLMRRGLPLGSDDSSVGFGLERGAVAEWWDLALQPEQKIIARFVLLLLLQDPARPVCVAEIADRLEHDPYTVNLILLLHASIGWVGWTADQARHGWAHLHYRLTERGAPLARHLLARDLTDTFHTLAAGLGLDTTVLTEPDPTDPGGGSTPPAAPTGHHPDDPTPDPVDEQEP